jgi:outer membrane protein OmpA-like peptidoglycan-associated protein
MRSGSASYNRRLSSHRVDAVAAELMVRGISRSKITAAPDSESQPLTLADGMREPRNRRVEIVLR